MVSEWSQHKMVVQIAFSPPEVISAVPEILDRVDPVDIGGLIGTVSTPSDRSWPTRKFWKDIDWEWMDFLPDLESPVNLAPPLAERSIDWGHMTTRSEYGVRVNAFLLSLDSDADPLEADVYGWFAAVADWLQAYTRQVLTSQWAERELPGSSLNAWRIVNGEAEKVRCVYRGEDIDTPGWTLVTPSIWVTSLRLASTGSELPLNWQLLVDSLRSLYSGHSRRAVIEAFTAVEVNLREIIRHRVERCGDAAVASVLINQRKTLGPLIKMAEDLGIELPDDLQPSLVELRNNAVHRGQLPSQDEALKVWEAAYTFAQLQSPLPELDSVSNTETDI
jgi:hypothetical protein